jgi:hypothetical protein
MAFLNSVILHVSTVLPIDLILPVSLVKLSGLVVDPTLRFSGSEFTPSRLGDDSRVEISSALVEGRFFQSPLTNSKGKVKNAKIRPRKSLSYKKFTYPMSDPYNHSAFEVLAGIRRVQHKENIQKEWDNIHTRYEHLGASRAQKLRPDLRYAYIGKRAAQLDQKLANVQNIIIVGHDYLLRGS